MAVEVWRDLAPSEHSSHLLVSLAEGTAGHSHASLLWEMELAEKAFFQGKGGCDIDLGTAGWPVDSLAAPQNVGGAQDARTCNQLGLLRRVDPLGPRVKLTSVPTKAKLSPG